MIYVVLALTVIALLYAAVVLGRGYSRFQRTINQRPQDLRRAEDGQEQVVPHTHVSRTPLN